LTGLDIQALSAQLGYIMILEKVTK